MIASLGQLISQRTGKVPSYMGDGVLPVHGRMIIAGPPGIGKSIIVCNMAYDMAAGRPVFGLPELNVKEPLRIMYVENEVGMRGLAERFDKIHRAKECNTALDNFIVLTREQLLLAAPLEDEENSALCDPGLWLSHIRQHRPHVIICDPLATMHNCDENSNSDMSRLTKNTDYITQLAAQEGIDTSWILIHHYRKRSSEELMGMQLIRGAGRIVDWADTRVIMDYKPEHAIQKGDPKHNYRVLVFAVVRQGPPVGDAWLWIEPDTLIPHVGTVSCPTGLPFG